MSDSLITVGEIVNTHGVRGEVKVVPHTDFAEQRFAGGSRLADLAVVLAGDRLDLVAHEGADQLGQLGGTGRGGEVHARTIPTWFSRPPWRSPATG